MLGASGSPGIAATGFSPAGNSPCPTECPSGAQGRQRHQRHGLAVAPPDIGFRVGERDLERRILDRHGLHQVIRRGVEDKNLVRVRVGGEAPAPVRRDCHRARACNAVDAPRQRPARRIDHGDQFATAT